VRAALERGRDSLLDEIEKLAAMVSKPHNLMG
jgi:hypothetical protein